MRTVWAVRVSLRPFRVSPRLLGCRVIISKLTLNKEKAKDKLSVVVGKFSAMDNLERNLWVTLRSPHFPSHLFINLAKNENVD